MTARQVTLGSVLALLLAGCGGGTSDTANQAPEARSVTVINLDGGNARVGSRLRGQYQYQDREADPEGSSQFRWLRNNQAITGATGSDYTVTLADLGTTLRFEVTPVAQSGTLIGAAVLSPSLPVVNTPPRASDVSISGNAEPDVGDVLTGQYTYSDIDGDPEGASRFRWLRNNAPIEGATALTYTISEDDLDTTLVFEVTPVAVALGSSVPVGTTVASAGLFIPPLPPILAGPARLEDRDNNGLVNAGDQLVLEFDRPLSVGLADSSALVLPVTGDSLGSDASLGMDPAASHRLRITLGAGARLTVPGGFATDQTDSGSPSGIDVAPGLGDDQLSGAEPTAPVDLLPGFWLLADLSADVSRVLASADLDGDGCPDLVAGRDGVTTLYHGDCQGGFSAGTDLATGTGQITSLVVTDINQDGHPDIIEGRAEATNTLYFNDGSGQFSSTRAFGDAAGVTTWLAVGDLDGDGHPDLVEARFGEPNRYYLTDGAGNITADADINVDHAQSIHLLLVDLNGDGHADIVEGLLEPVAGASSRFYLNDGSGGFDTAVTLGENISAMMLATADLDGNGSLDLVEVGADGVSVFLNDGNAGFSAVPSPLPDPVTGAQALALVDLDNDGHIDLVLQRSGVGVTWQPGLGNGQFGAIAQTFGALTSMAVLAADLDNDGDAELVGSGHGRLQVFRGSVTSPPP